MVQYKASVGTVQEPEPVRFSARYQQERFENRYCSQCDSAESERLRGSISKTRKPGLRTEVQREGSDGTVHLARGY